MPRKGYQTVTVTDAIARMLDELPGKSRMEKVEHLIKERKAALKKLEAQSAAVAIASIKLSLPNWEVSQVWELLDVVLERLKNIENSDDLTASKLLRKILRHEFPTDAEIIEVCQVENLSEEEMFWIRERLFPTGQKNGNNI
jgi:predicted HNH restriction endonuclease